MSECGQKAWLMLRCARTPILPRTRPVLILLQTIARRLAWLNRPLLLLVMALPVIIGLLLLSSPADGQDAWLIPSLLLFLWILLLYTGINLFADVPPPATADQPWHRRAGVSLRRGLYYILATLAVLLAVATIVTTYQLASVWVYTHVL